LNSPSTSASPSPEPVSSSTMVGRKNTMRCSPQTEVPLPVTYTPTTHRISKAKKGKRVHACEYPGCNKVCAPSYKHAPNVADPSICNLGLHSRRAPETSRIEPQSRGFLPVYTPWL
jgi:hypothetical protein